MLGIGQLRTFLPMRSHAQVTVITVAYNSEGVLPSMLASVPPGVPIIIVDNASRDKSALRQIAERPDVRLIEQDSNRGFGVACNLGAAASQTEFLLFLNPDAVLRPGCLEAFVDAARRIPDAAAFNPRITHEDGSLHFKRRSNLVPRQEWLPRQWPENERELPVLVGSAIFIARSKFDAVGGFDPQIFLYYEDDDLSLRLRQEVGPLLFVPQAEVMHQGGASTTRSVEVARIKGYHLGRSRMYAVKKHGKAWGRSLALLGAVLGAISPLVLVSKRKRAKEWARLSATLEYL
jgi:GT2 family glycosyltransferase